MAPRRGSMEVKVGALILVAVALLVGFVLVLGDFRLSRQAQIDVDFTNSGDLKTGAPVKITGVTVGKIVAVKLWGGRKDPQHQNKSVHVRVTLKMDPSALAMVHTDAQFLISTLGVLGEKYVEIEPGSQEKPAIAEGDVVDGVAPMRYDQIAAQLSRLAGDVGEFLRDNREDFREIVKTTKSVVQRLDAVVGDNQDRLKDVVANVDQVTKALAQAMGDGEDIKRMIASARSFADKLDQHVGPALAGVPRIVGKIEALADGATGLVADGRGLIASAGKDIKAALANVKAMTDSARDPKTSIGALLSDRELYDDLVALMKDLKRHPWKILFKE